MERVKGQGLYNVLRFNWHFYVLAAGALLVLLVLATFLSGMLQLLLWLAMGTALLMTVLSLIVTYWVYDASNLYRLDWLGTVAIPNGATLVNINAGFDETSALIHRRYPDARLHVFDFYDPAKHTEVSIKRARKAYPPYPGTVSVTTDRLPLGNATVDVFFALLAAHEIRDDAERIAFFTEVHRLLKPEGRVVVTEHLRDVANFAAYNIGAFHFHSKATWLHTFARAGFAVESETKVTPFISTFILRKHGTAS